MEAPADFQGGAGGIRNLQGIGPKEIADPRRVSRVYLGQAQTAFLQPALEWLEETPFEPALIEESVEPAAAAVILG